MFVQFVNRLKQIEQYLLEQYRTTLQEMLGLQSHLQEAEHSTLSIQSNQNNPSKQQIPSTNYGSSYQKDCQSPYLEFQPQVRLNTRTNVKELKKRLSQLEKIHENMNYKMNGFINVLQHELFNKQKINTSIQDSIKLLRAEVQQSRKDIEILSNLLCRNVKQKEKVKQRILNGVQMNRRGVGGLNLQLKNVRSQNKIGNNSPLGGHMFSKKAASPKSKNTYHNRHYSHHDNLLLANEDQKIILDGRKSTKLMASSPFGRQKFLKAP